MDIDHSILKNLINKFHFSFDEYKNASKIFSAIEL